MVGKAPPPATAGKENETVGWFPEPLSLPCPLFVSDLSFIHDYGCDDNNHNAQENERMYANLVPQPGPQLVTGVGNLLEHGI